MPLAYHRDLPRVLQRLCQRWWRRLLCDEWNVSVVCVAEEELQTRGDDGDVLGTASLLGQYLDGTIHLSEALIDADEITQRRIVVHELRHCHYAKMRELVLFLFDRRRNLTKADALALVDREVEQMIERDLQVLFKAYKR